MSQAKQKREVRKMVAPFNKVVSGGVTIEWSDSRKDAESAFKEAAGFTQWWVVQENGSASLYSQKLK